ncbi:MAG: RNA polymerase sigma-70 factor [Marinilabiliaceae bacterium]|jgi:RNA polymerase sigma-70 factor (ECF subfamily)|nr:RNA polymerase sigma-70 factor [Marinilabiliaceae bacterium]
MVTEGDILGGIRKGDIGQFELLFRSTYTSLVNYAKTILKDHDTAEEIVQELFYVLWRDRRKIKIMTSLNGYLFRAVYNRSMHHIEHEKVVKKYAGEAKTQVSINTEDPYEQLKYNELHEKIAIIIEKLPERCARIFCMSRFEGLKYSEIAEELSISVKTVEANMGKALKEFRNELL